MHGMRGAPGASSQPPEAMPTLCSPSHCLSQHPSPSGWGSFFPTSRSDAVTLPPQLLVPLGSSMTSGHTDPPPTEKQVGVSGPFPSAPWLWCAPAPQGLLPPARLHPPGGPSCRASSVQSLQGRWALTAPPETGPHPVGPLSLLPGVQDSSIVLTQETQTGQAFTNVTPGVDAGGWGAVYRESLCSLCREPDTALESERRV